MSGLPQGWLCVKVRELARADEQPVLTGPFGTNMGSEDFVSNGCPVLTIGCLQDGGVTISKAVYVSSEKAAELDRYVLRTGDLLFSRMASVGRAAMVPRELDGALFNYHIMRLRLDDSVVLPKLFLAYVRGSPAVRQYLKDVNHGATRDGINTSQLVDMPIDLPPIAEQKRIVAKIEELMARSRRAKEALDAVPPLLDQLRQSILAAAFRGDLTADWRAKNPNVEPAEKLLARIRAERRARWEAAELAKLTARGKRPSDDRWKDKYEEGRAPEFLNGELEVPKTWEVVSVEMITECLDSRRVPVKRETRSDGAFPYYGANGQVGTIGDFLFDEELVLVTEDETFYGRTKPIAYRVSGKCWVNNHAHVLRSIPPLSPDFLCQLLMHYPVWPWLSGTTGRAKLTQGALSVLPVPVPPLTEMLEITRIVKGLLAGAQRLSEYLEDRSQLLDVLDRAILSKAFRGELVPQDPSDEPASVLLERIRAARGSAEAGPGSRRRSRKAGQVAEEPDEDDDAGDDVGSDAPAPPQRSAPGKNLDALDQSQVLDEVFAALWTRGPLEKDEAIRYVAEHLREAGYVEFQRLRTDGQLYAQVLGFLEAAVKAGRLDRPKRGQVRACKPDATTFTADDWRFALVSSLGTEPTDREEAIRVAAEWARETLGLGYSRLRSDGHIVQGLRSALNSGIRRGEIRRHDATRISRAPQGEPTQLRLDLAEPGGERQQAS